MVVSNVKGTRRVISFGLEREKVKKKEATRRREKGEILVNVLGRDHRRWTWGNNSTKLHNRTVLKCSLTGAREVSFT